MRFRSVASGVLRHAPQINPETPTHIASAAGNSSRLTNAYPSRSSRSNCPHCQHRDRKQEGHSRRVSHSGIHRSARRIWRYSALRPQEEARLPAVRTPPPPVLLPAGPRAVLPRRAASRANPLHNSDTLPPPEGRSAGTGRKHRSTRATGLRPRSQARPHSIHRHAPDFSTVTSVHDDGRPGKRRLRSLLPQIGRSRARVRAGHYLSAPTAAS